MTFSKCFVSRQYGPNIPIVFRKGRPPGVKKIAQPAFLHTNYGFIWNRHRFYIEPLFRNTALEGSRDQQCQNFVMLLSSNLLLGISRKMSTSVGFRISFTSI